MAIKKANQDVTPKAEESVFEEVSAPVEVKKEVKAEKEYVEPKEEPAIPLSTVQQWMQDLEAKFTNQLNKLKTSSARESLDEEADYISELQDDWLEQPVVFFAFSLIKDED
jgi:hypothetical protein